MIQRIRNSRISKVISSYLALQMIISVAQPSSLYALTGGPSQPEFNSFTPIGTSDMVNLSSGDFNYNVPIMDVGGYPLNLAYDSGITMDQEASWVGLGWNLNVGQINRQVRGLPDDFMGDEMVYKDNIKDNQTVGVTFNINPQFIGLGDVGLGVSAGITMQHNNYTGISFAPSYGISFKVTEDLSVGMNLSSSASSGATVNPYVSISQKMSSTDGSFNAGLSSSVGVGYNSRQGLTSFNMSTGGSFSGEEKEGKYQNVYSHGGGGSISFVNNTFTPPKRTVFNNSSISFAISWGFDIWGIDAELGITGFGSVQKLKNSSTTIDSYGYNFTHLADDNSLLDFNREKEDIISKKTLVLPITNYTHDIFQINGQGTGGMFRPFRSQVGQVYNQFVQDESNSDSFGGEIEGGVGWHVGLDFTLIDGESTTSIWDTPVTNYFEHNSENNEIDFEAVYFKAIGEFNIDNETEIFNQLGNNRPIRIGIGGPQNGPGKYAENKYFVKSIDQGNNGEYDYTPIPFSQPIKREQRELRNKAIMPISQIDGFYNPLIENNTSGKNHHVAGYDVLNTDGSRYIYGETVYNTQKLESTFAVGNNPDNANKGTIGFSATENSTGNSTGTDHYFNSVETPPYAHTYLLTSVLSTDYEDLTSDGPTDDDLGAYTKFNYKQTTPEYTWRIPYETDKASFNQGLNSKVLDQKASIVEGKKELKYIETIETKTHVAFFMLKDRYDGKESSGNDHMKHIHKIFLFSKPEYQNIIDSNIDFIEENIIELSKRAIKVAHFDYNYTLCDETPNSSQGGKLTLERLYFTYRDSYMGKHTPYVFNYSDFNPNYSLKAHDIWGNYKPNNATSYNVESPISPQEFPFVQQKNKELQDQYASAWSLTSIDLPSGGRIELEYETDDYKFVQDREAMRMFNVVGVSDDNNFDAFDPENPDITLFQNGNYNHDAKYLIVEIPEDENLTAIEFRDKYLGEHVNKPIYFRFLLNMSKPGSPYHNSNDFDYVTGYFKIDTTVLEATFEENGIIYGAIPMIFSDVEGGIEGGDEQVNPISKAGWYFGRKYLPKKIYELDEYTDGSVSDIMNQLKQDFGSFDELIIGPNKKLRNQKLIARTFIPEKSWIRLLEPNDRKLGGGVRVTKIVMHDQWDDMKDSNNYNQFYGQEYSYNLEDGSSSGVATYEPNNSKENPFVEPFYNGDESLVAPRELNYVEKPFGESFFPGPTVTYSRVEVKNLSREREGSNGTEYLTKHATGKVVNEFYTSKYFPTIADYTDLDGPNNWYSNDDDIIGQTLGSLLGLNVEVTTELTLSQGFVVQTNDMNGKQKKQSVFNENGDFLSGVEYKYSVNEQEGILNNKIPTIDINGDVSEDVEVGMHYEVINDFKENYVYSKTFGMQGNVAALPFGIFIVVIPMFVPQSAEHTNILHTVTTTKVIHRTGIMIEKIAYDLGASVSTKNLAWDAQTGEILLTETANEYNDHYFNFTFPAYWANNGMGLATNNIGIKGRLIPEPEGNFSLYDYSGNNLREIFKEGDELLSKQYTGFPFPTLINIEKLWVVGFNIQNNKVMLMNNEGVIMNENGSENGFTLFKLTRSGYRNLQKASMASVTLMKNPIEDNLINENDFMVTSQEDPLIINASAVEYDDFWDSQCEYNLPEPGVYVSDDINAIYPDKIYNPYLYNVMGEYRAKKSFAFLTGRNAEDGVGIRNIGFFNEFNSYYIYDGANWIINTQYQDKWTSASEVTRYSPFGAELENRDALGRYSTAQYGYNFNLPVAVTSNSLYKEMGFDGFEDYPETTTQDEIKSHFGFHDENVNLSTQEAHTGRKSVIVNPNQRIKLSKNLEDCLE